MSGQDLEFKYHWFETSQPYLDFVASVKLPRKLHKNEVSLVPGTKTPYMVVTRIETPQEIQRREQCD